MKLPDAARLMSGVLPGCRGKNGIRSGTSQNMAEPDPHMNGPESENSGLPVILYFVADWPNLITLTGLCGGVLAIFFALEQNYPAAIIAMLWAVAFDWYDGVVARNLAVGVRHTDPLARPWTHWLIWSPLEWAQPYYC